MSGHTFKVGDRVRIYVPDDLRHGAVGVVRQTFSVSCTVEVPGRGLAPFLFTELRPWSPMSPEARMVWHAMRAGAKRVSRYHESSGGTTYRIHGYNNDLITLRVEIALPPIAGKDDES